MIRSYDLDTGDIIWQCSGLTGNVTPCPIVDRNVVYCMSGYEGYSLLALPLDSRGDISGSDSILWSKKTGTPYVPSPVLYDGQLYFTQSNQGILTSVDSTNGDTVIQRTRLSGIPNIYSSPVAADGRVYFTGRNGTTLVIRHSGVLEILATNQLDDEFNSSPAMVGNQLLLRGRKSLYCIEDRAVVGLSGNETRQVSQADDAVNSTTTFAATHSDPASGNTADISRTGIERTTRIHRLTTTKRSVFDAFTYLNRIPDEPFDEETTDDFSGRVFSRLANQEGRVLLKAPRGMDLRAYKGFKTFLKSDGATSVGNCSACHQLPDFTDGKSHIVNETGEPLVTLSLRNTGQREVDLRTILSRKLQASRRKKSGDVAGVSEEYSKMRLSSEDASNLIAFLKLLDDVSDTSFRKLILEAEVLDTLSGSE